MCFELEYQKQLELILTSLPRNTGAVNANEEKQKP